MDEDRSRAEGHEPSFRHMADALGLGMAFQIRTLPDGDRRFTYVGGLCWEMTGIDPDEALKDPARLYGQILPEHQEILARAEAAAIATLSRFEMEVRMTGPDGELRWRRITSTPTPQPDGSVLWDGILMDITEARRAAEGLREQRRRLEAAVEATGLGFWEWDVRNDRVVWSERNQELFGVANEPVLTIERYQELVHPEDREILHDVYLETSGKPEGGDFVIEHRTAFEPDGQTRWVQARGRFVKDEDGVRLVVGTTLDITERKAAEEGRSLLMGELAHRAKNGIQIMMAIVAQTARSAASVAEFEQVLNARLRALADSQDLVTASGGRPVLLADVVAKTLTPFDASRFDLDDGLAEVTIAGDVAVALALLLHELSTNAVKYGALSAETGRVALRSARGPEGQAVLSWAERGGPRVLPDRRRGFGSRLLEVSLRPQGGAVEPVFEPSGFVAKIKFPVAHEPRRP